MPRLLAPIMLLADEKHSRQESRHHALGKRTISLRLPQHLLNSIKSAANVRDVPCQSLSKVWLQEKLHSR